MNKHCYCVNKVIDGGGSAGGSAGGSGGGVDGGSGRRLTVLLLPRRC